MMSKFTERAQETLQRAQQLMFARQHTQLDVEHIFLALLQQRNSLPAVIITRLGGDVQVMVQRLERALDEIHTQAGGRGVIPGYITLRANRVLQGAVEAADSLKDDFISTEHLLISITAGRGGVTERILQEMGIDEEKVYTALRKLRGDPKQRRAEAIGHQIITPRTLVQPTGFSYGILTTGTRMLFLAGQVATDREGNIVAQGDIVGQYKQVLENLKAVVEEAGGKITDIVKMTIFVHDRDDYKAHLKELGKVHQAAFGAYYPATALLEISRFYEDDVLVEIEGIAVLESGPGPWI